MIKRIFRWIFSSELRDLQIQIAKSKSATLEFNYKLELIDSILGNIDVSVDVHKYSPSWAVISIQGEKADFIKFMDLGKSDLDTIKQFLYKFDKSKIDATPQESKYLRIDKGFKKYQF